MKSQLSLAAATALSFAVGAIAGKEFWLVERTPSNLAENAPQTSPLPVYNWENENVIDQENFVKADGKPFDCPSLLAVEEFAMTGNMVKSKYNDGAEHDVWRWEDNGDAIGGLFSWEENSKTLDGSGSFQKQYDSGVKGHCQREDDPMGAGMYQECNDDGYDYIYQGTLHCWID